MLKKLKEIQDNKILTITIKILYALLYLIVAGVLLVVVIQRFSNNAISIGGIRLFNIVSESMVPKYEICDVLLAKQVDPSEIEVGDDLVYIGEEDSYAGKIITHQVISIDYEDGEYKFHTKGIANTLEDPIVSEDQVYGKVIYKIQTLSILSKIINNIYLFYFLIFVPIVIILFVDIRKGILNLKEK